VPLIRIDTASGTTLRLLVSALPAFGYRMIDVSPGAAAPPPAPALLSLFDDAGNPATGAAVSQVGLDNNIVHARLKRTAGSFALESLQINGEEALAAPSYLLADYDDMGGLWRLGNEMARCTLTLRTTGAAMDTVQVLDADPLRVRVAIAGVDATREVQLDAGDAGLGLALTTGAAENVSRTASFVFQAPAGAPLRTMIAGGVVDRVPQRVYTPTFWPAASFASDGAWAVLLQQSTGVHFDGAGLVELFAVRDARGEQCDIEGGVGTDIDMHRIAWRIEHAATPAIGAQAAESFDRPVVLHLVAGSPAAGASLPAESALLAADGDGVITAIKPADRGTGVIVRALLLPGPVTVHLPAALAARHAVRTDALEHDLEDLGVAGDTLMLDRTRYGAIATVRLQ
jgi:hypothetical protein